MLNIHTSGYSITNYHKIELYVWQNSYKIAYINYNDVIFIKLGQLQDHIFV